jgi:hypothetical protein
MEQIIDMIVKTIFLAINNKKYLKVCKKYYFCLLNRGETSAKLMKI